MPFVALTTSEQFEKHVRERFLAWFKESGKSQREVGEPIEWEQQTVSAYFRGEQAIDFPRAVAWARYFKGRKGLEQLLDKSPSVGKPIDAGLAKWTSIYTRRPPKQRKQLLGAIEILEHGGRLR